MLFEKLVVAMMTESLKKELSSSSRSAGCPARVIKGGRNYKGIL